MHKGPHIGRIESIERLGNSVNGNPRFKLTFNNCGPFVTSSDIMDAYTVGNPGIREGDVVQFTVTRANRITTIQPAEKWAQKAIDSSPVPDKLLHDVFSPRTFKRNPQGLTKHGVVLESNAILTRMSAEAEQMTPNDAVRLAQRLLVAVDNYGIQQTSDFQSPQAVQKYVRQAIKALRGLSLS